VVWGWSRLRCFICWRAGPPSKEGGREGGRVGREDGKEKRGRRREGGREGGKRRLSFLQQSFLFISRAIAAQRKKSKHAQEHLETSPLYTNFRYIPVLPSIPPSLPPSLIPQLFIICSLPLSIDSS